jgi:EAL domain-containing protein (putative c-di-GMP-specific phosphodiesterase class I)
MVFRRLCQSGRRRHSAAGKSPREDALLKSVLATCAELHIETVAEWIDSPDKLQRCKDIGFHYGRAAILAARSRNFRNRRHT